MPRPKQDNTKQRRTFLLGTDIDDFIKFVAETRHINSSSAINLIVISILRSDFKMLSTMSAEYHARRQF